MIPQKTDGTSNSKNRSTYLAHLTNDRVNRISELEYLKDKTFINHWNKKWKLGWLYQDINSDWVYRKMVNDHIPF